MMGSTRHEGQTGRTDGKDKTGRIRPDGQDRQDKMMTR
jgi:hypothetical protein